ncbi:tRNA (adenine(22)-N(1))-methyltransferase [Massilibacterium senegalense]|uniref:tRNA (adenine(22)-N(1))-methyltransferase n=1 Tax=Massilibacterium senegalense TaxID=1632858 RepID=UPI000784B87A|nr:tRNA (adenine(22)-N(1))-methyltransferase TrmK [Massilibacterium senegalense]
MNEHELSKRLELVASFIPKGAKIADIGSDHAYLPTYAYLKGLIQKAIAGEVNNGPYELAKNQVETLQLTEYIDVRKGNGLHVLKPGEVTCVTIAGMGGSLIRAILEEGKEKLIGNERLILQPNNASQAVRKWLFQNEYELLAEMILEEDEKIYEILVAEKGIANKPYEKIGEVGILVGPFLAKEQNEVFQKKWTQELEKWESILEQLNEAADQEKVIEKKQEITEKITKVRSVLRS